MALLSSSLTARSAAANSSSDTRSAEAYAVVSSASAYRALSPSRATRSTMASDARRYVPYRRCRRGGSSTTAPAAD